MKYKRILFCILPFLKEIPTTPFVGVGYLSEYLSHNNIENNVINMNLGYSLKDLLHFIDVFNPDLIGFSMMTRFYKLNYRLINLIKSKYKLPCVVGGPHVSTFRKKVLEDCNTDFGIKLEGEITLIELMSGNPLEDILGLIYRKNSQLIENPDRPFIKNLDEIPFPRFKKFELNKYRDKVISISTSRGCPYQCIYCPVKLAIGQQFRMRSAEKIFDEIIYWYNKGFRRIDFIDDNFTLKKERVIELCRLIINFNKQKLVLSCPNGVRADRIDREILNLMKKAGFMTIAFGVEGGNNKTLKTLKKGENIEEIGEKIKLACDMGFNVNLFFLIGSPGETESDVEDSFKLALKYPIVNVFFYNIVPYPQTELYEWLEKEKLLITAVDEYLNYASPFDDIPYFTTEELSNEKRIELITRSKQISKKIRKMSIRRRFRDRYGYIGQIIGLVLSTDFFSTKLLSNRIALRLYTKYITYLSLKH